MTGHVVWPGNNLMQNTSKIKELVMDRRGEHPDMAHQHHSGGQQGSAETAPLEKAQELSPGGKSD